MRAAQIQKAAANTSSRSSTSNAQKYPDRVFLLFIWVSGLLAGDWAGAGGNKTGRSVSVVGGLPAASWGRSDKSSGARGGLSAGSASDSGGVGDDLPMSVVLSGVAVGLSDSGTIRGSLL